MTKSFLPFYSFCTVSPFYRFHFRNVDPVMNPIAFYGLERAPVIDRRGGNTYRGRFKNHIFHNAAIPDPDNFGRLSIPLKLTKRLGLTINDPESWAVGYNGLVADWIIFFPCWKDERGDNLRAMFSDEIEQHEKVKNESSKGIQSRPGLITISVDSMNMSEAIEGIQYCSGGIGNITLGVNELYLLPEMVKTYEDRRQYYENRLYLEIPEILNKITDRDKFNMANTEANRPIYELFYDPLGNLFLSRERYQLHKK